MKRFFVLVITILTFHFCNAQVIIANDKMNIVYVGVENPLSIAAFDCGCNDIILKADIGRLTKTDCGKYLYLPSKIGVVHFTVLSLKNGIEEKLSTLEYRVKELSQPVADNQNVTLNFSVVTLRKEKELSPAILGYNYSDTFSIVKFDYLFVRDTDFISSGSNDSAMFNKKLLDEILHLLPGDKIFFENIIVQDKNGELKKLNSICLKLAI